MKELAKKVENYYDYDDRGKKYIEKALIAMSQSTSCEEVIRMKTEHTDFINEEDLFCGIDKAIAYLTSLKEKGYTSIEQRWSGYEDNYFIAIKISDESDIEYYKRLADAVKPYIKKFLKEDDEKKARKERIKQLQKELQQLKKEDRDIC